MTADTAFWTLILRWLVVAAMLFCAWEAGRITTMLDNKRLIRIVRKIAKGLAFFALARLAASFVDDYVGFGIGLFSNLVNYAFWGWIYWYFRRQRRRLQDETFTPQIRLRLSRSIDEVLDDMRLEYQKLTTKG
ncbi:MAG TPA: hypothetical protein VGB00_14060 [Pyrinomonadaceae bacterium]